MITLRELVELVEIRMGQVLIPISAFGYTYDRLERIFQESVRFFERYYPWEKEAIVTTQPIGSQYVAKGVTSNSNGIIISDCIQVIWARQNYGNFRESMPKLDKKTFQWFPDIKLFTTEVQMKVRVGYGAHYPMGYLKADSLNIGTMGTYEDSLELFFKGHFKKGSFSLTLDEGITPESTVSNINLTNYQFTIDSFTGSKLYTGALLGIKTEGTLPNPFIASQTYYVIKDTDTLIRLALTRQDALNNIPIVPIDIGIGEQIVYRVPFEAKEILSTYTEFTSTFTVDVANNFLTLTDNLFMRRVSTGDPVVFRLGTTLPSPLAIGTTYYLIVVDTNIIKLATTRENALLGTPIDLTTLGTGANLVVSKNNVDPEEQFIHIRGTLGEGEIQLDNLRGTFFNLYGLEGDLLVSFTNKYKAVDILDLDLNYNDFFLTVFRQRFCEGLGRQKMTVKLDGLPVDITADDLMGAQTALQELVTTMTEQKSKWWIFA